MIQQWNPDNEVSGKIYGEDEMARSDYSGNIFKCDQKGHKEHPCKKK